MSQPSTAETTIPRLVAWAGEEFHDRQAVVDGPTVLTYAELAEGVRRVAQAAGAHGLRAGDRVGVWAPNSYKFIMSALGLLTAGCTVVPLNTRYRGNEVREFLRRTAARALLVEQGFLGYDHIGSLLGAGEPDAALPDLKLVVDMAGGRDAVVEPGAPRSVGWRGFLEAAATVPAADVRAAMAAVRPDGLSEIIFTSGTTGVAKGVMLTHAMTMGLYRSYGEIWGIRPGDRYLITLPLFHTGGNKAGMITSIMNGATMIPMAVFDTAEAMRVIERERVTVMNGPPTVFSSILDHPERGRYDLSSLRLAATGATVVPTAMVERALTELPFENFITAYGLTECCGTATMCRQGDSPETVAATNGAALPGVEVRVVDGGGADTPPGVPGEIIIRGANVTPGYWQDPATTAATIDADGWLHSGDIGALYPDGNLKITDRLKDVFIVGGFNVSPAEVEQVMARHPDISEVAIVGVPDSRLGEVGRAYIVAKPGTRIDEAEVIAWCRERLANFKVPRSVSVLAELPRNASGKVLKRRLRAEVVSA